jgi:hypothetical protein
MSREGGVEASSMCWEGGVGSLEDGLWPAGAPPEAPRPRGRDPPPRPLTAPGVTASRRGERDRLGEEGERWQDEPRLAVRAGRLAGGGRGAGGGRPPGSKAGCWARGRGGNWLEERAGRTASRLSGEVKRGGPAGGVPREEAEEAEERAEDSWEESEEDSRPKKTRSRWLAGGEGSEDWGVGGRRASRVSGEEKGRPGAGGGGMASDPGKGTLGREEPEGRPGLAEAAAVLGGRESKTWATRSEI